jgi:hypothetical protein
MRPITMHQRRRMQNRGLSRSALVVAGKWVHDFSGDLPPDLTIRRVGGKSGTPAHG